MTLTIGELKRRIANMADHIEVLVMAEDETLNAGVFEDHTDPMESSTPFVVISLPDEYDTYYGKKRRG